jgi:chromosome segregation ATPase
MSGAVLSGANDTEKLDALAQKTYKDQAVWFLNSYWDKHSGEAEKLWTFVETMAQIDLEKKAEGTGLDEAQAHRFLEKHNETMTVSAMREKLRSTGAIGARIKLVPLIHLLIFKYNSDWKYLVNAPQGSKEEIDKAQKMLDDVQAAFAESESRAEEAKEALALATKEEKEAKATEAAAKAAEAEAKAAEAEAKAREDVAKAREADARQQEAPFKAAQEEVDKALADVRSQESARDNRTEDLKRKSNEGGVVQQNKAKAELAQHLATDPLPLSKAKITLEAALKKAEKSRAPFEAATKEAEAARAIASEAANKASQSRAAAEKSANAASQARAAAEKSRQRSEAAKDAAEAALEDARQKLEEAEAYLQEAKNRLPKGSIWWLERELQERRKYMPERKGGVKKN